MKFSFLFIIVITSLTIYSQDLKKNDSLNNAFNTSVSKNFYEAERIALLQLQLAKRTGTLNSDVSPYLNLSKIYLYTKENKKSLFYCQKSLELAKTLNNKEIICRVYNRLALLELRQENYINGISYVEKARKIAEEYQFIDLLSDLYFTEALILRKRIDNKNSLKALNESIKIRKKHNFRIKLAESYNLKANFIKNIKTDSAIYYFNNALKIAKEEGDKYLQSYVSSNLGSALLDKESYSEALKHLKIAESLCEAIGNKSTLHYVNVYLGYYYEDHDNYTMAIQHYEKAINEYGKYVDGFQLAYNYYILSGVYSHIENYKLAYKYQDKYVTLADSILDIKKTKEFDEIRTEFEVERKNSKISLLEKEKEIAATRKKWLGASAIFLSFALLGVYFFFKDKIKTKDIILSQEQELHKKEAERLHKEQELNEVKAYIDGQEKERNRLAKELHDGVGGKLASINLTLSHINTELKSDAIKEVNKNLSGSFEELRALSHSLSTNATKDKSFKTLLAELNILYQNSNTFNIEISVFPEDILNDLESKIAHNLYRILQELMNNIVKHAKAKEVLLSFSLQNTILIVIVEDDGCGFDVDISKHGIGIKNIEERIVILDGNLKIDSFKGRGTHVIIELPYKTENING